MQTRQQSAISRHASATQARRSQTPAPSSPHWRRSWKLWRGALLLASICLCHVGAIAATIEDPRPGSWIVDEPAVLPADTRASMETLCAGVRSQTGGELIVVIVRTIGGVDARRFAHELFNRFGIGDKTSQNGVLLFVAMEDRAAELILGNGIDSDREVQIANDIMQNVSNSLALSAPNQGAA